MKKEFTGVVAHGGIDKNGIALTPAALRQLAQQAPGKPVDDAPIGAPGTTHIGKVVNADYDPEDGSVVVRAHVDVKGFTPPMFAVPHFIVRAQHFEAGVRIVEDMELLGLFLTNDPADAHLTPIDEGFEPEKLKEALGRMKAESHED